MLLIDVIVKNYYFNNSNPSNKQNFFYIKRRAYPCTEYKNRMPSTSNEILKILIYVQLAVNRMNRSILL